MSMEGVSAREAAQIILRHIEREPALRVPLDDALGSVLADDVVSAVDVPAFAFTGFAGFLLWLLLTQAYARAPAQSLAVAEYSALIWSALLGYFFFSEIPRWQVWIGALVIVAAVMLSAWDGRRAAMPKVVD